MKVNLRLNVGSSTWVAEERSQAVQIETAETEEFTFSARNEFEWLNEHMAEVFSENQVNVAEIFKTPGKLRGKTPRTVRKGNPLEARAPLSDVFSATPKGAPSPFKQFHFARPIPTFQVAEDEPEVEQEPVVASTTNPPKSPPKPINNAFDSGYHGSQAEDATQMTKPAHYTTSPTRFVDQDGMDLDGAYENDENVEILGRDSDARRTTERSFESAQEDQPRILPAESSREELMDHEIVSNELERTAHPVLESPLQSRTPHPPSPQKRSPERPLLPKRSPLKEMHIEKAPGSPEPVLDESAHDMQAEDEAADEEDEPMEDVQSQSEGSSPIRPIVRKSSLNFASLPAREPLTTKKSIGNRVSRTSHIEPSRTSYYGRMTGGKSLGNVKQDHEVDEMDIDDQDGPDDVQSDADSKITRLHNKTSTQRLQDQISMLGQSQTSVRPSKSLANTIVPQPPSVPAKDVPAPQEIRPRSPQRKQSPERKPSPHRKERPPPGAFPEDEEDSWIGPPPAAAPAAEPSIFSPRPQVSKSHSTDVMEDIRGKETIAGAQFGMPKRVDGPRNLSPVHEPTAPEKSNATFGHIKSVSTSVLRSPKKAGDSPVSKVISVSNPTASATIIDEDDFTAAPKSPARSTRGSPFKGGKDKFSSILKSARGLFASSAAISAEAKSSALSPPPSRMGVRNEPSFEDILSQSNGSNPVYPNLDKHNKGSQFSLRMPESPFKASARKTRASTEREEKRKEEEVREAREAKEAKEAQKVENQLEKARNKVREEAHREFVEQEKAATKQKELAARKEREAQAKASQAESPRATRSSPRKTKAQLEAEGIAAAAASVDELSSRETEMVEASHAMPPPAIPRPKSQIGRPQAKRPLKPAKEPLSKAKPPTVIRVDTGSQRGQPYHPSNSTLSATLEASLGPSQSSVPPQSLRHKASTSSIQSKSSTSSFKSAASKASKTLEAAAKKKEQDEQAARQRREAKEEIERQRAANKEGERRREEEQRRQEVERQREAQREKERKIAQEDAKRAASRQAIEKRRLEMEKAKETRPPPPAARPQHPSADMTSSRPNEKALPPIPPQRGEVGPPRAIRMNTAAPRTQEERPASVMHHNSTKAPPKRPLQQDPEEHVSRPTIQRAGPSYQNEHPSKRRRTSENFDEDDDMPEYQAKMTAPPIRQSSSRPKEFAPKSLFPSGYANAPPGNSLQRSTLISQHNMNQSKPTHPMDMAQVSKAPIAFASSSSQSTSQHKTPARPGAPNAGGKSAKSAAKSSPGYQNGENIVLPEIHTDSEEEDSDGGDFPVQGWTNSPDLRRQLLMQENLDPATIFGQPGPLNMEEVFSKSKDRFHKFRNRTSSANWSGTDKLTEEDIRKDLEARDKVRRQGGWTYDSMV